MNVTSKEPEKCVAGENPNRCAYAGQDGLDACAEECLVAKGRRDYPALRDEDLLPMTPEQVAEVRAQRR